MRPKLRNGMGGLCVTRVSSSSEGTFLNILVLKGLIQPWGKRALFCWSYTVGDSPCCVGTARRSATNKFLAPKLSVLTDEYHICPMFDMEMFS